MASNRTADGDAAFRPDAAAGLSCPTAAAASIPGQTLVSRSDDNALVRLVGEAMKRALAGQPTVLDQFRAEQAERNRRHEDVMALCFSLAYGSLPRMPEFSEPDAVNLTLEPKP